MVCTAPIQYTPTLLEGLGPNVSPSVGGLAPRTYAGILLFSAPNIPVPLVVQTVTVDL